MVGSPRGVAGAARSLYCSPLANGGREAAPPAEQSGSNSAGVEKFPQGSSLPPSSRQPPHTKGRDALPVPPGALGI